MCMAPPKATYHFAILKLLVELICLCMSVIFIIGEGFGDGDSWRGDWGGLGGTGRGGSTTRVTGTVAAVAPQATSLPRGQNTMNHVCHSVLHFIPQHFTKL